MTGGWYHQNRDEQYLNHRRTELTYELQRSYNFSYFTNEDDAYSPVARARFKEVENLATKMGNTRIEEADWRKQYIEMLRNEREERQGDPSAEDQVQFKCGEEFTCTYTYFHYYH